MSLLLSAWRCRAYYRRLDVTPRPSPPSSSHRLFLFRSSWRWLPWSRAATSLVGFLSVPARAFYECA
ncbi:hypothetical protein MUK42_16333 [Musa troglodytarum]|uniref:Uncharacterized protein n=1 Tax=Musa troglodytarum TaxID=320322 RepID=A0A9E7KN00_9LILI|nr:hypothetical protein MUK42_16333 [Musa troglodytarum]